jgi:hypothetical protein
LHSSARVKLNICSKLRNFTKMSSAETVVKNEIEDQKSSDLSTKCVNKIICVNDKDDDVRWIQI